MLLEKKKKSFKPTQGMNKSVCIWFVLKEISWVPFEGQLGVRFA